MRAIRKFSLTLAATAILLLLAVALTSVGANPRVTQSSPAKPPAKTAVAQAMKTYTIYTGLWRTDGGFVSTIRVKNVLVVAPMDVTPVLFMADGTPYPLRSVHLAVSGVATININDALATAPPLVASHISQFGSAALIHTYSSPGHVSASMVVIDVPRSLSYTFPFSEPMGDPMQQTLEGLWWKHDPNVSGWIALSNVSDSATQATLQLVGHEHEAQAERTIALPAHTTQMLHLKDFADNPSPLMKDAGGIRVEYNGQPGSVLVTGGLENDSEGYSANIPFWGHDMSSSPASRITYAFAGLMLGKPDPMMMTGFPKDTTFTPYLILGNTSEKPLDVGLQLNYMAGMRMKGSTPVSRNLRAQHLAPLEARQVDMQAALNSAGLASFNGSINLSASFTGNGGDLLLASGSVDQTGTYVFEVEPQGTSPSRSKYASYWNVANGNDTMFSLWNPTEQAQDIVATLYYGDGSGKYVLPVHLEPQASAMIDLAMLIMEGKPDVGGNIIPSNIQEGSADFASAKGRREQMTLVIAGGIYNVADATCGPPGCITCCGDSNFGVSPNPIICLIGESMQCGVTTVDCNGYSVFPSSWSSSNTGVMTVNSSGVVTGVAVGTANITAIYSFAPVYTGQMCGGQNCPTGSPQPSAPANDINLSCSPSSVTRGSSTNCTVNNAPSGAAFSNWKFTDSSNTVNGSGTSGSWSGTMATGGTVSVQVSAPGSNPATPTASITVTPRTGFAFTAVAATKRANPYSSGACNISVPTSPAAGNYLGFSCLDQQFFETPYLIGDNGPNNGFRYVSSASSTYNNVPTTFNYIIAGYLDDSSSEFAQKQWGNCGFISYSDLKNNTYEHESGNTTGHYATYKSTQDNSANNVGVAAEAVVGPPGQSESDFNNQVRGVANSKGSTIKSTAFPTPDNFCNSDVRYNPACVFRGNINWPVYVTCP